MTKDPLNDAGRVVSAVKAARPPTPPFLPEVSLLGSRALVQSASAGANRDGPRSMWRSDE